MHMPIIFYPYFDSSVFTSKLPVMSLEKIVIHNILSVQKISDSIWFRYDVSVEVYSFGIYYIMACIALILIYFTLN
jgi:hypothetical protein